MPRPNKGPELQFRDDRSVYEIVWRAGGRRRSLSTGTGDRGEAHQVFAKWLLKAEEESAGPRDPSQRRISDVLAGYAEEHGPEVTDGARIGYAIKALLPFWGDKMVSHIDEQSCRAYQRWRENEGGVKTGTVLTELRKLRAAIHHDHGKKRLSDTVKVWMPREPDPKDRWLTHTEAAKLLRAARKDKRSRLHLPLFILLGLYTAARKETILSLRWTQVDFVHRRIDLNPPGRERTSKGRPMVPIPSKLMTFLKLARRRSSDTGYVVEYFGISAHTMRSRMEKGEQIIGRRVDNIKHAFASACANAGLGHWETRVSQRTAARTKAGTERFPVTDVTPHTLRHTAASWMVQGKVPFHVVADYLGHDDIQTTIKIYAHHHPDYLKEAADALNRKRA